MNMFRFYFLQDDSWFLNDMHAMMMQFQLINLSVILITDYFSNWLIGGVLQCYYRQDLVSSYSTSSLMYETEQPEEISDAPLMELFIETLTGSSMILYVSPLDTVLDVKTYIQKREGKVTLVIRFL